MNSKTQSRHPAFSAHLPSLIVVLVAAMLIPCIAAAQAPSRLVGTITAISGNSLTVKPDTGDVVQVAVPAEAAIKRIAPGQKDLSTAASLQFSELAVGDRVLVKLDPDAPAGTSQALQIVAVKQADVAMKQQKDREDWQRRGVGGLVKSVDSAGGVLVLTSGIGAAARTVTVRTTKTTMLKRYAPASVSFDAAMPAPLDAIHPGDQLRARGAKNADGTQIDAEEVVSGSFRNISGTITSLDPASSTLVVKDLVTKKQVTIHIPGDAQMRRLPDRMAQMLAARFKAAGGSNGSDAPSRNAYASQSPQSGGGMGNPGAGRTGAQGEMSGQPSNQSMGGPGMSGAGNGSRGAGAAGDAQQMLSRAPAIQIADLKKGDAVMLVSTEGAADVTAITLLAGVEPLLEAPAASQNMLNNWSMGGGAGAAEAAD
jgi:hypothetical protein